MPLNNNHQLGDAGHISDHDTIANFVNSKGQPNGVAPLDATGAVPSAQLANGVQTVDGLHGAVDLTTKYLTQTSASGTYQAVAALPTGTPATDNATIADAITNGKRLRAGTYVINASIAPATGKYLLGHARGYTTIQLANAANVSLIAASAVSDFTWGDLTLDGNNANNTAGSALACTNGVRVKGRNYRVVNTQDSAIIHSGCTDCSDDDVEIDGVGTGANLNTGAKSGLVWNGGCTGVRFGRVRVKNTKGGGFVALGNNTNCEGGDLAVDTVGFIGAALSGMSGGAFGQMTLRNTVDNALDVGTATDVSIGTVHADTCLNGVSNGHDALAGTPYVGISIASVTVKSPSQFGVYLVGPAGASVGWALGEITVDSPASNGVNLTGVSYSTFGPIVVRNAVGNCLGLAGATAHNTFTSIVGYDDRGPKQCHGIGGTSGGHNRFVSFDFDQTLGALNGTPLAATDSLFGTLTGKVHAATPGTAAASAVTTIPLDTSDVDTGGFTVASSAVSVPVPGRYLVSFYLDIPSAASGNTRDVWVEVAGVRYAEQATTAQTPNPWRVTGTDVITFAAGDTATVKIYHDATAGIAVSACHLSLVKIG